MTVKSIIELKASETNGRLCVNMDVYAEKGIVRDFIESMLRMLREHSAVGACLTNMTVHILEDNDNEENN